MKKVLEKFDPIDVFAFTGMTGCIIIIVILRRNPSEAITFKEVLLSIMTYYLGRKSAEVKKNGNGNEQTKAP